MRRSRRPDDVAELAALPLLTSRRAARFADCDRSTLQRSGPAPVGKRGRTFVYRTADVIAWMSSGLERPEPVVHATAPRSTVVSSSALARLRAIAKGSTR